MTETANKAFHQSDQIFINKLTKAVESNLEVRQFGVEDLAREVGMSRSLIYRKLQSISNQSVSRFIREIRLRKAMDLLEANEGSVSDIAYRVGFGSPAYFITCFHEKYGYPPGEVKYRNLPKETKKINSPYRLIWVAFGIISILTILILTIKFYFISGNGKANSAMPEKSIAVLPFENLSNDPENKYIAFGIVDNILSQLSGVRGIRAISRTSSAYYARTTKSISEIGQELDSDYILEGSVQKYEENILIIVQLIKASDDKHIWSDEYNIELKDFLKTQSKISKQIAKTLNTILSNEVIESVEQLSTENVEAHNMYIKGRYFLSERSRYGFDQSLTYFSKAIEIDPEYALAYAGLANTYSILTSWREIPVLEGYPKSREYALKALDLNESLAEARVILAEIYWKYERNFKLAEKQYKMAMDANPNYASTYFQYSVYLWCIGQIEEARNQINRAKELDPLSKMIHVESASQYYHTGLMYNALAESQKILEIDPDFVEVNYLLFLLYKELDMPDKAFNSFKKIKKVIKDEDEIDNIYYSDGIDGLLYYLIDFGKQNSPPNYLAIAEYYALAGKKEEVLFWLKRLMAEEKLIAQFLRLLNNRHFAKYRNDPEFQPIFAEIEQIRKDLIN